jgi:hypothetical protein
MATPWHKIQVFVSYEQLQVRRIWFCGTCFIYLRHKLDHGIIKVPLLVSTFSHLCFIVEHNKSTLVLLNPALKDTRSWRMKSGSEHHFVLSRNGGRSARSPETGTAVKIRLQVTSRKNSLGMRPIFVAAFNFLALRTHYRLKFPCRSQRHILSPVTRLLTCDREVEQNFRRSRCEKRRVYVKFINVVVFRRKPRSAGGIAD